MDKKIVLVSLIVLLLIIYYKKNIGVIEKMSVVEAFNKKKFLVRDLNDKKESADILAKLMENLKLLISTLRNTNNPNDKELQKFKPFIETIYNRIDDVKSDEDKLKEFKEKRKIINKKSYERRKLLKSQSVQ